MELLARAPENPLNMYRVMAAQEMSQRRDLLLGAAAVALPFASQAQAWPDAAQVLNRIRQLVAANLVLGLLVVLAAVSAR